MLTVIVKGQKYSLPKAFILVKLPVSLLAEALRSEPDVTSLTLTHPSVTAKVMVLLQMLSKGEQPLRHKKDIIGAHRYLNIPSLLGYGYSSYEPYRRRGNIKPAFEQSHASVVALAIAEGWKPQYEHWEISRKSNTAILEVLLGAFPWPGEFFRSVCRWNGIHTLDCLLRKGNGPIFDGVFDTAVFSNRSWIVKRLCEDERTRPADLSEYLISAVCRKNRELIDIFVTYAATINPLRYKLAVLHAAERGNLGLLLKAADEERLPRLDMLLASLTDKSTGDEPFRAFLDEKRYDWATLETGDGLSFVFYMAVKFGWAADVKRLLQLPFLTEALTRDNGHYFVSQYAPKFPVDSPDSGALILAAACGQMEVFDVLLEHGFDPRIIDRYAYKVDIRQILKDRLALRSVSAAGR